MKKKKISFNSGKTACFFMLIGLIVLLAGAVFLNDDPTLPLWFYSIIAILTTVSGIYLGFTLGQKDIVDFFLDDTEKNGKNGKHVRKDINFRLVSGLDPNVSQKDSWTIFIK